MVNKTCSVLLVIVWQFLYEGCNGKLIENESYLRSVRLNSSQAFPTSEQQNWTSFNNLRTKATTTPKTLKPIDKLDRNHTIQTTRAILNYFNASKVESKTSKNKSATIHTISNIPEVFITHISSTHHNRPPDKMQRKMDTFGPNDKPKMRKFFYAFHPFNETNSMHKQDSKDYINYKTAYGIRFNPNKIRRSFNLESVSSNHVESVIEPTTLVTSVETENVIEIIEDTTTTIKPINTEGIPTEIIPINAQINDITSIITTTISDAESTNEMSPTPSENSTPTQVSNIMQPSRVHTSSIQQHLSDNHVKNLLSYGLLANSVTKNSQRFLNIFNVIKFANVPCWSRKAPLTPLNGTCYNQNECDQLGGVVVDDCADGYGVCCVFQYGCGGLTQQSISYFKTPNFPGPYPDRLSCTMTLQLFPNVKSVLLDFIFFEMLPPIDGSCSNDQFIIIGQSVNQPVPIFCGINSGQHLYLDVEGVAERQIILTAMTSQIAPRAFNVRLSQLEDRVAPQGCLQYYTEPAGFLQTFNYDDTATIVKQRRPSYFNNLNYAICIKRATDFCAVAYTNQIGDLDFQFELVNVDEDGSSVIPPGQAGAEIFNCADDFIAVNGIRLCGERLNDASITADFTVNAPVTDYSAGPIILPVRTNADIVGRGFKLYYEQQPCSFDIRT